MAERFLYGAATSSHQVEGNNIHNDWWAWERAQVDVEDSGRAADHYNRFREDFALAAELGHTAHRFSIEWSRIEPERGKWNTNAIEHYRQVLQELRRHNMKTFVTLHHFTTPLWLTNRGGWIDGEAPELFARYAKYVAEHLGELVDFWVTINEPLVYATQSYWQARWPPQVRNVFTMHRVIRRMAQGHRRAYRVLRQVTPQVPVGIAKHVIANTNPLKGWWFNHRFFNMTGKTHDFVGVNFYFTDGAKGDPQSDLGWAIRPESLTQVLLDMNRYGKPIYITENGLADRDDDLRPDFIRDHLRAVEQAQHEGADVRGYLHWSLLDNFEWSDGFDPRFGLIEVDYATMERRVRPSAYVYKAIISQSATSHHCEPGIILDAKNTSCYLTHSCQMAFFALLTKRTQGSVR